MGKEEKNLLDLPPELIFSILEHMVPPEMTGLACASKRTLYMSNVHLKKKRPSGERQQGRRSETGWWIRLLRNLPSEDQAAIMGTRHLLPFPNILTLDKRRMDAYLSARSACVSAESGYMQRFEFEASHAEGAAKKAGLPTPDFEEARRRCWVVLARKRGQSA